MPAQTKARKKKHFRSLTVTLATAILTLTLVVLSVAGFLEIYFSIRTQRKAVANEQQLIAQDAARTVKVFIQEKFSALETAVSIGNLLGAGPDNRKLILEKLIGLEPAFRQLVLLNEEAEEILTVSRLSSYAISQISGQIGNDLVLELKQGKKQITPIYIDEVTSEPLVVMAVPVKDVFHSFMGVLMAEVNLKFMWDLVGGIKIGKKGVSYVVDKQGDLIAFGDISRVLKGENLIHLQEVGEFVGGDELTHHSSADISKGILKTQVVSNHAHLGNPDWAVIVEVPVSEAYKSVFDELKLSTLTLLLSFILAIVVGIYLSRRITRPVIDLRNATKKISKGRLDTKIKVKSNDEIGDLAISFNQMVEDLNRTTVSRDELAKEVLERNKVEKALRKAKRQAEAASQAKSQFLANMSHEIRTPMNAIIGFTELLHDTHLDEVQSDYVKTVNESGNALLSIINDILDLSKVEEDKFALEYIDFDFMYLIESILKMIRSKIIGSPIDVSYHMEEGPRYFKGDPTRIRQILINLLGNAVKFTKKGKIFLNVGLDASDGQGEGEPDMTRTLRLSIRDTGIGIPKEKRDSIFESFTQADTSTTRQYGGTGLGLSIAKAFVERMGGDIWVESEEGKGSEFIFTLRLKQADSVFETEIEPISLDSLAGKRVAIVDDNDDVAEILREYCTGVKMEVQFIARSAKEALSSLGSAKTVPDLIVSDMMMQGIDGHDFIENIRKDKKLRHLKVIAASSEASPGQSLHAKKKGFNGYLGKPVIRDELISVIKTVLGDKRKEDGQIITRHLAEEVTFKMMKVLVVEDNPVNMKLMERLLAKYGFIIDKAKNGKEAVEKVRANSTYTFVLMDVQMPEMNGIEATEIIRKDISKDVPIIALTAAAMREDRERALAAGMNDFVVKPISIKRLKEIIQQYCD